MAVSIYGKDPKTMIKGVTVRLVKKTLKETNAFGEPIYTEELVDVEDVLVGEPSSDDVVNTIQLYGKHVAYTLAIPKGDVNEWVDTEVILPAPFEGRYLTIGYPTSGIDANIPLRWNKKVKVERYG